MSTQPEMRHSVDASDVGSDRATPRPPVLPHDDPGESSSDLEPKSETKQLQPPAKQPDTLYAVHVFGVLAEPKSFYRPTPFGGIDLKLSESSPPKDDNEDALIHVGVYVDTKDLGEKKGNTAQDWWLN